MMGFSFGMAKKAAIKVNNQGISEALDAILELQAQAQQNEKEKEKEKGD